LLCQIHKRIFTGVRGFAGLHRSPHFGSDRVNFYGSLRSPHKDEVPLRLQKILEKVQTCLLEWKGQEHQSNYDLVCIQLALKTHADLIGLQPFEDGNKRTSRAFMNWLLIKFGLRPIAFEVVQQDYALCMVTYLETKNLEPLLSLALGVYDI
jgi:fido (protein-threonine AMPylation protein)